MGRQVLIGALLWLTINGTLAVNLVYKDNVSAQSGKQLYRGWPMGMYASAAPYGAYSVPVPFIAAPKPAASSVVPVKETIVYNNPKGYTKQNNGFFNLKDSYGNRYVQAPHSSPLRPSFPQQFLQLQDLPAHFAQPLSAAPLNYNNYNNYKQASASPQAQIVYGSQYKLPVQSAAPSAHKQYSFSQSYPGAYTDSVKNFSPQMVLQSHLRSPVIHIPPGYTAGFTLQQNPTNDEHPNNHQQSTSSEAIYSSTQTPQSYHVSTSKPQYQPIQHESEELYDEEKRKAVQNVKQNLRKNPVRETQVKTVVNGQKTIVNLKTKPTVPLLDISLLEPLTFDNPLVPQVQHFLPRINQATYHKLPELNVNENKKYHKDYVVHKTKTYDTGVVKGKPKKGSSKRKHKHPTIQVHTTYGDEVGQASTARPAVVGSKNLNESPEIIYEINSPNYKETVKEQAISYNKETNSEPVHYNYGTTTHEEPVHITYIHSSKEPIHIKEVRYESHGEGPAHVSHDTKSQQENNKEDESNSEESDESEESEEDHRPHQHHDKPKYHEENHHQSRPYDREEEYHHEVKPNQREVEYHPETKPNHREEEYHHQTNSNQRQADYHHEPKPNHREKEYHHQINSNQRQAENHHEPKPNHREKEYHHHHHHNHHQLSSPPYHNAQHKVKSSAPPSIHHSEQHSYQPVAQYEEEIHIAAPIKVDPNQHIQTQHPNQRSQPTPQFKPIPSTQQSPPQHTHHNPSPVHVQEKTKQIIIQEETPEDAPTDFDKEEKEEDKEQDFEKAYKNAAFGFPAYNSPSEDHSEDIFNPESYGVPRDHSSYSINNSPFQQYQGHGDPFPKTTRLSYMDTRDKTKEDYFLDYSVKKPESLMDQYKKQVEYYKLYKQQKPEKYTIHENDEKKKSEKYSAIPYDYYPKSMLDQMAKQVFAQYKTTPFFQEFDYSKGEKRDNTAYQSRPYHTIKMNTHFVEPQFQYGFEPIALPRLLDSELAAMASNNSPKSDPGLRKKLYKENFYIKTTNTDDRGPNS